MRNILLLAGLAALGVASAASAQPYPPYNDTPATYPWRNGAIEGPAIVPPAPEGPPIAAPVAYDPGAPLAGPQYAPPYPGQIGPGVAPGQVFPLPNNGGYVVTQAPDGSLLVTRYGPVWTNKVGPNGWAHRHYYHYGWPWSGLAPIN